MMGAQIAFHAMAAEFCKVSFTFPVSGFNGRAIILTFLRTFASPVSVP